MNKFAIAGGIVAALVVGVSEANKLGLISNPFAKSPAEVTAEVVQIVTDNYNATSTCRIAGMSLKATPLANHVQYNGSGVVKCPGYNANRMNVRATLNQAGDVSWSVY